MKKKNYISITLSILALTIVFFSCKKETKETNPLAQDNNGSVGTSANSFLSEAYYNRLTVEVLYMPGYAQTDSAVNNLRSFLIDHLNKPAGIEVLTREIPSYGQESYSSNDIVTIESENREKFNANQTITASLIILDSDFADNNQVLGLAYKNTSMAIFGGTIADYSGGISQPTRSKLESTVINHEFGHLLGLVNLGSDMVENHQDTEHGKHCTDDQCLMYYAAETTEIASFLIGNTIPELDQNCKNDLIANGGK
jgi:predicted Zn-dependent protease